MKKVRQPGRQAGRRSITKAPRFEPQAAVIMLLALVPGLALAICTADVFVPYFWARLLLVQAGYLLSGTIVAALVLSPSLRKFMRRATAAAEAMDRAAWFTVAAGLLVASAVVIGSAFGFRAGLADVNA